MIGDQLYTDVWAGNFAGVDKILVKPQTHVDLWYTQIFHVSSSAVPLRIFPARSSRHAIEKMRLRPYFFVRFLGAENLPWLETSAHV